MGASRPDTQNRGVRLEVAAVARRRKSARLFGHFVRTSSLRAFANGAEVCAHRLVNAELYAVHTPCRDTL